MNPLSQLPEDINKRLFLGLTVEEINNYCNVNRVGICKDVQFWMDWFYARGLNLEEWLMPKTYTNMISYAKKLETSINTLEYLNSAGNSTYYIFLYQLAHIELLRDEYEGLDIEMLNPNLISRENNSTITKSGNNYKLTVHHVIDDTLPIGFGVAVPTTKKEQIITHDDCMKLLLRLIYFNVNVTVDNPSFRMGPGSPGSPFGSPRWSPSQFNTPPTGDMDFGEFNVDVPGQNPEELTENPAYTQFVGPSENEFMEDEDTYE